MKIKIYTIKTENHYKFGMPAAHVLDEPTNISSEWVENEEYELPDGYTTAECNSGTTEIYNKNQKHCPLIDGKRSKPTIIDGDTKEVYITLKKAEKK